MAGNNALDCSKPAEKTALQKPVEPPVTSFDLVMAGKPQMAWDAMNRAKCQNVELHHVQIHDPQAGHKNVDRQHPAAQQGEHRNGGSAATESSGFKGIVIKPVDTSLPNPFLRQQKETSTEQSDTRTSPSGTQTKRIGQTDG